jgi:hypothetical protein
MTDSRPVAITVSTNYSDLLEHSLELNHGYFRHWYIVTAADDYASQQILSKYHDRGVETLLFDFYADYLNEQGDQIIPYFNKGGAIRMAQEKAYREYPDHWYLCMDTDIIIRNDRDIITHNLYNGGLYGASARYEYRSWNDYCTGRWDRCRQMWMKTHERLNVIGFFQLYKDQNRLYPNGRDTTIDGDFTELWPEEQRILLPISVDHLGYWAPEVAETIHGRSLGNGWLG